jgi:hypothetical protein
MEHTMRSLIGLFLASSFILHPSSFLRADGGTVRFSQQRGSYRITVFTTPTPLRAGSVDISVLVQDGTTGELLPDTRITITATSRDSKDNPICQIATTEAATNKLFQAALFDLPQAGPYALEVSIDGNMGSEQVLIELEVVEPLPTWLATWPWVAWPFLVIILFGIHLILVRRRSHQNTRLLPGSPCPASARSALVSPRETVRQTGS